MFNIHNYINLNFSLYLKAKHAKDRSMYSIIPPIYNLSLRLHITDYGFYESC